MRLSYKFLPQYGPEHLSDLGNTCELPQHLSAAHLVIWSFPTVPPRSSFEVEWGNEPCKIFKLGIKVINSLKKD